MNEEADRLLTVQEVKERLNCSDSFVYDLLSTGRLKHHVLGRGQGGKRVSEEQLREYLRSTERGGGEEPPPAPPPVKLRHLKA